MNWGMITYEVPLERHPKTYNGQPLCFAGLAAQKNHLSLYFMPVDAAALARLKAAFKKPARNWIWGSRVSGSNAPTTCRWMRSALRLPRYRWTSSCRT